MNTSLSRHRDYEQLAADAVRQTGSEELARQVCDREVAALQAQLQPQIDAHHSEEAEMRDKGQGLFTQLYTRHAPVSDLAMIGRTFTAGLLALLTVILAVASCASHAFTFGMLGAGLPLGMVLGMAVTGVVCGVGHLAIEQVMKLPFAPPVLVFLTFVLCLGGLVDLARARGTLASRQLSTQSADSFVDGDDAQSHDTSAPDDGDTFMDDMRRWLNAASLELLLAADLSLAWIFGLLVAVLTNPDFAAWRHLGRLKRALLPGRSSSCQRSRPT
jgi:hypothetical protein